MAAVLCLVLAGCGITRNQSGAVGTFGKSATLLAWGAKTAYAQALIDEGDLWLVSKVSALDNDRLYRQKTQGWVSKNFKGRTAAADALAAYGAALTALIDSKTQESDLSAAADKLTVALKGIPAHFLTEANITTAEIDNVSKAFVAVGELYLDAKRREILQKVIPAAEPIVTRLCGSFRTDFDYKRSPTFASTFRDDARDVLVIASASIKDNGGALQNRAILLPLYQKADLIRTKAETAYIALAEAADACVASSRALKVAIDDPTLTLDDVVDFATKAEAAYSAISNAVSQK
jgi:hypothetical protein